MKKKHSLLVLIFILAIMLAGCRQNKEDEKNEQTTYNEQKQEDNFGFENINISNNISFDTQKVNGSKLMKYNDGYLFPSAVCWNETNAEYNIVYLDMNNNQWTIMCNNPTCSHMSANCISYIDIYAMFSMCSDGKQIYFLKTEQQSSQTENIAKEYLYKINMETFEQEKITEVMTYVNGNSHSMVPALVYGGYYYSAQEIYSDTGEFSRILYRCRLEKDAVPEFIYGMPLQPEQMLQYVVTDIEAQENYVYYTLEYSQGIQVVRLDLKTGETLVKNLPAWSIDIKDDKIYLVTEKELYEYSNDFEESRKICSLDKNVGKILAMKDYLLFYITEDEGKRICLYNYNGEKKEEFYIEDAELNLWNNNEDFLFFTKPDEMGNYQFFKVDIQKLQNGVPELEEITKDMG